MLHEDDTLSDNTGIKRCTQCKECVFWDANSKNYFENAYDKLNCRMFPFPDSKPRAVVENTGKCEYRIERK